MHLFTYDEFLELKKSDFKVQMVADLKQYFDPSKLLVGMKVEHDPFDDDGYIDIFKEENAG